MSLNDFAVQLYLTLLAIAAAPILLSWVLRRIAGEHAPVHQPHAAHGQEDQLAAQRQQREQDQYWYAYDMGMLPESPHD